MTSNDGIQQNRELAILSAIAQTTGRSQDVDALLNDALDRVVEGMHLDGGAIYLLDQSDEKLHLQAYQKLPERFVGTIRSLDRAQDEAFSWKTYDTGEILIIEDVLQELTRRSVWLEASWIYSLISVPLRSSQRILGVMDLASSTPRTFRDQDIQLLTAVGVQLGLAIENARLYEQAGPSEGHIDSGQLVRVERLRALGEMAGGVAHNFNNVLTAILGNAQLLLMEVKEKRIRDRLKIIEQAAIGGAEIVRRIQDFARLKEEKELTPLDLNQLVRTTRQLTRHMWKDQLEAKDIHVDFHLELGQIPPIAGNLHELEEVFTNLILNAIDAMPQGGALTIRTWCEGDVVCLSVSDTGIGMSEEVQAKLFDPFFTTKGDGGSGLGLAVSYGIIQRHQGTIQVDSREGVGTQFTFTFPRADSSIQRVSMDTWKKPTERARLLIIDDEPNIRQLFCNMFPYGEHEITVAPSGGQGLDLFRQGEFDVVFTDIGMPGMSGWEVARRIRAMDPLVPIIVITGWGKLLEQDKIQNSGIDFVVTKPFQVGKIFDTIAQAMELKAQREGAPHTTE